MFKTIYGKITEKEQTYFKKHTDLQKNANVRIIFKYENIDGLLSGKLGELKVGKVHKVWKVHKVESL